MFWRREGILAGLLLMTVAAAPAPVHGAETDQYFAMERQLRDSLDVLNEKVNRDILGALDLVNRRGSWDRYSCSYVAKQIYERFRILGVHKIELWADQTPLIDRVPSTPEERESYHREHSLYRNDRLWDWALTLGVKPTIHLNGVRMGTDKLSHFFQHGWKYYQRYEDSMRSGRSHEEAIDDLVRYGISNEKGLHGLETSGVFSFADLEAAYQGFRFYESLCRLEMPRIIKTPKGWTLNLVFNWRDYVNPDFDESYNNSAYTRKRWSEVAPVLRSRYCDAAKSPEANAVRERYATDYPGRSESAVRIEELRAAGATPPQAAYSLSSACGMPKATSDAARRRGSGVRATESLMSIRAGGPRQEAVPTDIGGGLEGEIPYETPEFDEALYRPMIELGGGGVAGASSDLNVLLRVRLQVDETIVPRDPKYTTQTVEHLIWARLSGDVALIPGATNDLTLPGGEMLNEVGLPYMDIRFVPVERRVGFMDEVSGTGYGVGLALLPSRFTRFIEIDRSIGVEVSVVGVSADYGFRHAESTSVFAKVALDALGYKAAAHASELRSFHGAHIGNVEASFGADFVASDAFSVRVILGGVSGISLGWTGGEGFGAQSDLKMYGEVQADISRLIRLFGRGQIDAIWNGRQGELRTMPTLQFGAAFVF